MSVSPDQTRGEHLPLASSQQAMSLSQNEVAALCMKAARGAGMSWGLAEEAGFAAAWLMQHGVDGPEHLYRHLAQAQGRAWETLCPKVAVGAWQAPVGQALCPIALGATLCDYANLPEGLAVGCSTRFGLVDQPVLLLPFLISCAETASVLLTLAWEDGSARLGSDQTALIDVVSALDGRQAALTLSVSPGVATATAIAPAPPTLASTIAALGAMAMRTTVPTSAASRAGAGSTTGDND